VRGVVWGACGLLAQGAFAVGWVVAETWQGPRYNPLADTISDLQAATAPRVWFPIVCFAAGGLGTFGFAVFGLRPAWAGAVRLAPWAIGLSGLALGNSFPLIPCQLSAAGCTATGQLLTPGGLTDAILSGTALWALAITPFPLSRLLAPLPRWSALAPLLRLAGMVAVVAYALLAISLLTGAWEGLFERVLVVVCQLWLGGLAVHLMRTSRRAPSPATGAAVGDPRPHGEVGEPRR
jgi:hypothetical protein